jgi:hypothetical protein
MIEATEAPAPSPAPAESGEPAPVADPGYRETLAGELRAATNRERAEAGEITDDQFEPLREEMQRHGITTKRAAVERWANAERALRERPADALRYLTRNYAGQLDSDGAAQVIAEIAHAARLPVDPGAVAGAHDAIARQREAETHAAMQQAAAAIERFAAAKDADGEPLYPRFEQVKVRMGELIQSGAATTLEAAYAKVVGPGAATRSPGGDRHYRDDLAAELAARKRA